MSDPLDVIIIGAGSAGLSALRQVMKRTQRFVIINDGPWGTLCARAGCMPSKALIAAANAFHARRHFGALGISGASYLSLNSPAMLEHVRALRDDFVASNLEVTMNLGDRAISGRAQLLGPQRVRVNGRELNARSVILSTGSTPVVPQAWLSLRDRLLTTDALFEQEVLPKRMAVAGQGVLGVELAQAMCRLGVDTVAFGDGLTIAGITDPQVNATAVTCLRRELPVHLGDPVELSAHGNEVRVRAGPADVVVDKVLVALGRRPQVDGLGLETLGVDLNEHGVPTVDSQTLQVGQLPVFLVGDANGESSVLHEATDDGRIAGLNATATHVASFQRRVPLSIVFTDPTIARVGARYTDLDPELCVVGDVRFDDQSRARIEGRNQGILRIYVQRDQGRLLGAELCAPAGEHLAHLLALAMTRQLTVPQLLEMPFYHPVFEESLRTALTGISFRTTMPEPPEAQPAPRV